MNVINHALFCQVNSIHKSAMNILCSQNSGNFFLKGKPGKKKVSIIPIQLSCSIQVNEISKIILGKGYRDSRHDDRECCLQ